MSNAPQTPFSTRLLINGEFIEGEGHSENIHAPATGEIIARVKEASAEQVEQAVAAAKNTYATWSRTTPQQRSVALLEIAELIEQQATKFAEIEALNCGKPLHQALEDDLSATVDVFRFFAGAVRCQYGQLSAEYVPGYTSMVRRSPLGVVASIAPWNYPLMMAAWKIAPALAAGNTLVFKPSEHTPLTILELAAQLGTVLPVGCLNIVCGSGENVGGLLARHRDVRMISLTGDIVTGQKVLRDAVTSLKRTHLELGGKAPVIVCNDADIDLVVEGIARYGYYNAGQDCTAACRIYAQAGIHDRLVEKLGNAVSKLKFAQSQDRDNDIGPLISCPC